MNSVEASANRLAESGGLMKPGMLVGPEMPVACSAADVAKTALAAATFGYVLGRAAWAYNNGYVDGVFSDGVAGFQGTEATLDELIGYRSAV